MRVLKRDVKKERKISPKRALKYTHFAVAGKSSYENERRSLRHHHMMISDAEGLKRKYIFFIFSKRIRLRDAIEKFLGR